MKVIKAWLTFIFTMTAFLWSGAAFGCSCLHNFKVTVEDLWANDLIFKGEVISVKDVRDERGLPHRQALFRINKLILSPLQLDTISIDTPGGNTSCGLYFREGDTWLIFADGHKSFSASSCGNSRRARDADTSNEIDQIIYFLERMQRGDHSVRHKIEGIGRVYELIGKIENGKPNGQWVKVSGSDTIAWLNFQHGVQIGKQMDRSHPAGGLDENDIAYVDGEKVETKRMYSADGKMKTLMQFKNGVLHGSFEMQYGNWKEMGQYIDGKEEGEWSYYSDGKIVSRTIYADGRLLGSIQYDHNGRVIKE